MGCVVLKRLADAERDGDRVYAVIQGIGSASDGRSLGLTAPRPEGQRAALERAYRTAGIGPEQVGLVEAHGTGTVVGDRTELATLEAVFTEAGAAPGSCVLGSVKSQIGHTKCAAGLAGLIKAALALHTGVKPRPCTCGSPTRPGRTTAPSCSTPRPGPGRAPGRTGRRCQRVRLRRHQLPHRAARLRRPDAGPRPAGVAGGAVHLPRRRPGPGAARGDRTAAARPGRRLPVAAARPRAGRVPARGGGARAGAGRDRGLQRRGTGRPAGPGDGGEHAPGAGLHLADPDGTPGGEVAFLFPGQGSQKPGMFAELFTAFPQLQRQLRLGRAYADLLYPRPPSPRRPARDSAPR
ncbi:hypothetical protein ACFQ0M_04545 [Kitasatospora aburaviensis]